jgi:hypothetical protein
MVVEPPTSPEPSQKPSTRNNRNPKKPVGCRRCLVAPPRSVDEEGGTWERNVFFFLSFFFVSRISCWFPTPMAAGPPREAGKDLMCVVQASRVTTVLCRHVRDCAILKCGKKFGSCTFSWNFATLLVSVTCRVQKNLI